MADYKTMFDDPEHQNWVKCALAVHITRDGLLKFVENEIAQFLTTTLRTITSVSPNMKATCNSCETWELLPCPTSGMCKKTRGNCKYHTSQPRPCPAGICNKLRIEIEANHQFPNPSWKNTDSKDWCTNPWQIAKCYMSPDGYKDKNTAEETDFNGIVNVILNCMSFHHLRQHAIPTTLFEEAREVGRSVRHSPHLKIDAKTTSTNVDTLYDVLNNPALVADQNAQSALQKLIQLKQDTLRITSYDAYKLLEEISSIMKDIKDEDLETIEIIKEELEQLKERSERLEQEQEKMKKTQTEFQVHLMNHEKRLDQSEHEHENIKHDVSNHSQRLGQVECEQEDLKQDVTTHDQRLQQIELEQKEVKQDLDTHQERIVQVEHDHQDIRQKLDIYKEKLDQIGSLGTEKDSDYESLKTGLQDDLVQFYTERKNSIQLSPLAEDMDVPLDVIYVPAAITHNSRSLQSSKGLLKSYKDIFCPEGRPARNIYIQGEAGLGKSTFSAKLTQDWCEAVSGRADITRQDTYFADVEYLKAFKFLFFISLREIGKDTCDINEMIQIAIITECVLATEYTSKFLARCIKEEPTLIILDGLDEWTHANASCRRFPTIIPHRSTGTRCTVLTFTRPWKLNGASMKESYIDALFDIKGVVSFQTLLTNVLKYLNRKNGTHRDLWDQTGQHKIKALLKVPIMAMQLLFLWYENHSLPESKTQLYSEMIEMLLQRSRVSVETSASQQPSKCLPACLVNKECCENNTDLLDNLGLLAFHTLYSKDNCPYIVFPEMHVQKHLSDKQKQYALSGGLLTQHKVPSLLKTYSTFCFLHKSYQEFMAAYYLATNVETLDTSLTSMEMYYEQNSILDIEECFTFLCGMNKAIVPRLTDFLWKHVKPSLEGEIISIVSQDDMFRLLKNGEEEIISNNLNNEHVQLPANAVFSKSCSERCMSIQLWSPLEHFSKDVSSSVTYIHLEGETVRCMEDLKLLVQLERLQYIHLDEIAVDMQCQSVELNPNLSSKSKDLDSLNPQTQHCLPVSSTVKHFVGQSIKCTCEEKHDTNYFVIDMEKCTDLEFLVIADCNCTVKVNSSHIKGCNIEFYNLMNGDVSDSLSKSTALEYLELVECSNILAVCESLSNKHALETLIIHGVPSTEHDASILGDIDMRLPTSVKFLKMSSITMTETSWLQVFSRLPFELESIALYDVSLGDVCLALPKTVKYIFMNTVTMSTNSWYEMFKTLPPELCEVTIGNEEIGDIGFTFPNNSVRTLDVRNLRMPSQTWCKMLKSLPNGLEWLSIADVDLNIPNLEILLPCSVTYIHLKNITMALGSWTFLNTVPDTVTVALQKCKVYSDINSVSMLENLKKKIERLNWIEEEGYILFEIEEEEEEEEEEDNESFDED